MRVTVILKKPAPNGVKEFDFGEHAILDDSEAGRVVLSCGVISGGRTGQSEYSFKDFAHVVYSWDDIERLEVTP